MEIKLILVPLDLSEASLVGLEYAAGLAELFHAELLLLFVVEPLYYAGDLGLLLEEQRRFGHEELGRIGERLTRRGVPHRSMILNGTPYAVIADEADRQHADLIVMATHGRTGLSHLFLGSVAEKVVRLARVPVLTVRPTKSPAT